MENASPCRKQPQRNLQSLGIKVLFDHEFHSASGNDTFGRDGWLGGHGDKSLLESAEPASGRHKKVAQPAFAPEHERFGCGQSGLHQVF